MPVSTSGFRYRYDSLADNPKDGEPQVRYLSITSGASRHIQCKLETAPLTSGHICLSHRWYDNTRTITIFINNKPFEVSEHLWNFLNVARTKYDAKERFWIDAICINQADILEKNKQVPLMGRIYSSARCVVSWLGNDENLRQCVQAIRKHELKTNTNHFKRAISATDDFWDNFWDNITKFFEIEYWSRIWVVQEVLLANDGYILVGDLELDWPLLTSYWRHITRPEILPQTHSERLAAWGKTWHRVPEKATMRTLLEQWGRQLCNEPHDHVYALRALAEDGERIKVNYNLTPEQLLFETLVACGSDKCFCLAGHLVEILKINDPRASDFNHMPSRRRRGLWKWKKTDLDHETQPFISFAINEADNIYIGEAPRNPHDKACLNSLRNHWLKNHSTGIVVRFFYTPVPADFVLRYNDRSAPGPEGWYVAGIRFDEDREWMDHYESFSAKDQTGITVHTTATGDLCCLRLTRSALLKLLLFGGQHTMCDELSYGEYEILDPERNGGQLLCGKSMGKGSARAVVADRRRNPFRHPSTCSTPRPMTPRTPSVSPQLSRNSSEMDTLTVAMPTVVPLTGWSRIARQGDRASPRPMSPRTPRTPRTPSASSQLSVQSFESDNVVVTATTTKVQMTEWTVVVRRSRYSEVGDKVRPSRQER